MKYLTAVWSDVGIRKKTNQDSVLIETAGTDCGEVLLAAVCDGMGGLSMGEIASAVLIRALSEWFENRFPLLLGGQFTAGRLQNDLEELVKRVNDQIMDYSDLKNCRMGTTMVTLLIANGYYYVMNIGDSRAYMIDENLNQITRDQTFVQREMDEGRMTWEEARVHPQRNMLLQCVGASEHIVPAFYSGYCREDTNFLVCSDGFRHVITPEELLEYLNPQKLQTEAQMQEEIEKLIKWNKERREVDNITALLVRTKGDA